MRLIFALVGIAQIAGTETQVSKKANDGEDSSKKQISNKVEGDEESSSNKTLKMIRSFGVHNGVNTFQDICHLSNPIKISSTAIQGVTVVAHQLTLTLGRWLAWTQRNVMDREYLYQAALTNGYLEPTRNTQIIPSKDNLTILPRQKAAVALLAYARRGGFKDLGEEIVTILLDGFYKWKFECEPSEDKSEKKHEREKLTEQIKKITDEMTTALGALFSVGFGVMTKETLDAYFWHRVRLVGKLGVTGYFASAGTQIYESIVSIQTKSRTARLMVPLIKQFTKVVDQFLATRLIKNMLDLNAIRLAPEFLREVTATQNRFLEELGLFFSMGFTYLGGLVQNKLLKKFVLIVARFNETWPYLWKMYAYAMSSNEPPTISGHRYFQKFDPKNGGETISFFASILRPLCPLLTEPTLATICNTGLALI